MTHVGTRNTETMRAVVFVMHGCDRQQGTTQNATCTGARQRQRGQLAVPLGVVHQHRRVHAFALPHPALYPA